VNKYLQAEQQHEERWYQWRFALSVAADSSFIIYQGSGRYDHPLPRKKTPEGDSFGDSDLETIACAEFLNIRPRGCSHVQILYSSGLIHDLRIFLHAGVQFS